MDSSAVSAIGGAGGFVLGAAAFVSARYDRWKQRRDQIETLAQTERDKREADAAHQPDAAVARLEVVSRRMDLENSRLATENEKLRVEADKVGRLTNEAVALREENARVKAWAQQSIEDRDLIIKQNQEMKSSLMQARADVTNPKRPKRS